MSFISCNLFVYLLFYIWCIYIFGFIFAFIQFFFLLMLISFLIFILIRNSDRMSPCRMQGRLPDETSECMLKWSWSNSRRGKLLVKIVNCFSDITSAKRPVGGQAFSRSSRHRTCSNIETLKRRQWEGRSFCQIAFSSSRMLPPTCHRGCDACRSQTARILAQLWLF